MPPPGRSPRVIPAPAEAPAALARVLCIVAGEEIGARACIAQQCERKCFCPKASFAINAMASHVLPGTRLERELEQCRTFARTVLLSSERFYGPARDVRDGKPVAAVQLSSPVPLPAPPRRAEQDRAGSSRIEQTQAGAVRGAERQLTPQKPTAPVLSACEIEGCGKQLRVNNLSGLCQEHRQKVTSRQEHRQKVTSRQEHRQKVTSRQRAELVPAFARSAGTAGELLALAALPIPETKAAAATAAEEKVMLRGPKSPISTVADESVRAAYQKYGGAIEHLRVHFGCSWGAAKKRCNALGLTGSAKPAAPRAPRPAIEAKAPRTVEDVAAKHVSDDVVVLLEQRRAFHVEQAERIDRALQALRA